MEFTLKDKEMVTEVTAKGSFVIKVIRPIYNKLTEKLEYKPSTF